MRLEVLENLEVVLVPYMDLFLVGALAGTWLVSWCYPSMSIYGTYGWIPLFFLQLPWYAAIISVATGKFMDNLATVGIALWVLRTAWALIQGWLRSR